MQALATVDPRDWAALAPHYAALAAQGRRLTPEGIPAWLRSWSDVRKAVWEGWTGVKAAQEHDLTDGAAQETLQRFTDEVMTPSEVADAGLAAQLLADFLEETLIATLPALTLADAFQHRAYATAPAGAGPADADGAWRALTARFTPWVDWSGLEAARDAGWQRCWSLFLQPFYDLVYVVAMAGALQVWQGAQRDREAAWGRYRAALSLGSTRALPDLFAAAGARWPFARGALGEVVALLEATLGPA